MDKEVVSMRHENEVPADRHPLAASSALLEATLAFAVSAAIVFFLGPGWVIGWASSYSAGSVS